MSPRLTYKNIAILGLTQIGIVVFGVLGVGVAVRMGTEFGMQLPQLTKLVDGYGSIALVVPLFWITIAMIVQHRNADEDDPEVVTFCSGLVILFLLLAVFASAAITPWLRITQGLSA